MTGQIPSTDTAAKIAAMRTIIDVEAMRIAMQLVPEAFTTDDRALFKARKLRIQAGKA